jgi:hypothetical protein
MTKHKPSKLDAHAERLEEWFLAGKTLKEAQEQLRLDGCAVSLGRLSAWWQGRQAARQEEELLRQIASGAAQHKAVEAEFARHPAPELETIIKLHRVLIMKLSTQANAEPDLLETLGRLMKPVLEFAKLNEKRLDRELDRDRFEFDAAQACLKALPELKVISADSGLSETQKVEQIRLRLFGEVPE